MDIKTDKYESNSHVVVAPPKDDSSLVFEHFKELLSVKKDVLKDFVPRKLSKELKILYLDVETSPILAMTWGTFNVNIAPSQIIHPSSIMCFAAQWDHEKKVIFDSINKSAFADMMKKLWKLLDEADLVVHYNGKKFDIKRINREFVKLRLGPTSSYAQIDMLQIVKAVGGFDSNKLEWVSQAIGIGSKIENSGMSLWIGCMQGDKKQWTIMEKYNKQDTRLLKYLYHTYLPWIRVHPNHAIYQANQGQMILKPTCTNCGSTNVVKNGRAKTKTQMYQRYRCSDCNTNLRGRTTILAKESRSNILVQEV